jgi:hypothetical protein
MTTVAVIGGLLVAAVVLADWRTDVRGGAGRSVSLRSQFTTSSLRMIAAAPITGVGIGQYYPRSNAFFTPELRQIYGYENAHNYFLQQFAELGIVGGLLFLWLVLPPLALGWKALHGYTREPALIGLFAGTTAYLSTCLTGHPLLVPEAVFPFWIALGAVAGAASAAATPSSSQSGSTSFSPGVAAAIVGIVLAGSVGTSYRAYATATAPPPGYGFHEEERDAEGTTFRWMTRRALAFVEPSAGVLRVRVKAPARRSANAQPVVLETLVSGRTIDRRELPFDEWVSYEIGMRDAVETPFRRIELRLNQVAWESVERDARRIERPIGVMIGEIRLIPLT